VRVFQRWRDELSGLEWRVVCVGLVIGAVVVGGGYALAAINPEAFLVVLLLVGIVFSIWDLAWRRPSRRRSRETTNQNLPPD
jgi:hypothetical protein